MCLFDLVQKNDRLRILDDSARQDTTRLVTDISRRRAKQFCRLVVLRELRHVNPDKVHILLGKTLGEHRSSLSLTYTGWTTEQVRPEWTITSAHASHWNQKTSDNSVDSGVLTDNVLFQGL